ncbi:WxL domain-containing protein [Lactiplantibacillus sp. DA1]|uniref:WxL domain-containing protein n=1 Tax=Lactiplantibacillus sp. DA1 TaxID=3079857 RepID=UPI00292A63C0|nr:WxL domain-containing protein [Lactiplantibacillus sp. DA1]MDV0430783.1 WxL domain-containing protein [Lactiplantibacillus sp. DA1]
MKKTVITATMLLSLLGMPAVVATANSTAKTTTDLKLTENTGPTVPVDPTNPANPQDPDDPENPATGNTGALTLDVAPKTFNFGSVQTYADKHTYQAMTTTNVHQYLQVTDNRGADEQGWVVTVEQDRDLTETSGTSPHILTGTTIHVPVGIARNSLATDPTAVDNNLNATVANVTNTSGAVTVFSTTATMGAGKGTSVKVWDPTEVTLTIPKNTAKPGTYANNLTWTLTAATPS